MKRRFPVGMQALVIFLSTTVLGQVYAAISIADAWASTKILNYSWQCNLGPLNPHDYSPNQMFAQAMVYDPLVKYGGHGEILPCLAWPNVGIFHPMGWNACFISERMSFSLMEHRSTPMLSSKIMMPFSRMPRSMAGSV
jgi:hypothetical protein